MSSFRRTPTTIHRHLRSISTASSSFIIAPLTTAPNSDNRNPKLLRWISAVVAGTGIGVYLCSDSSYGVKSVMSVADWLSSSVDKLKEVYHRQPLSNSNFFIRDALRRRIFFNYEKRLRMLSPPEKVFEYFASVENTRGEILMTPGDLMRAIVPVFPPSESNVVRDGSLRGEKSPGELHCAPSEFFMLFDVNNDGLISFKEYIFFVTLLSIPESSFAVAFKMFDIDNDGEIDREEFKKVMTLMRSYNRQGAFLKGGRRAGHRVGGHVENGGVVEYFFGEDGNKRLQHEKFVQFLRDLHHEMVWLEFSHYDFKSSGTIPAKDFVLSMVASAMGKLMDS
uniref:Calcium uptake protein, mitochondrial n=1 Tax=Tanacetum cinerariifolium TaxID=118510 RepID=A0A6L2MPT4_TANCI|nr:calcium uptake protein, mitochondrial [Tanacetum cinerariifolium]